MLIMDPNFSQNVSKEMYSHFITGIYPRILAEQTFNSNWCGMYLIYGVTCGSEL